MDAMVATVTLPPLSEFARATRLEWLAGATSPSDPRRLAVRELQELVEKVNVLLERRDGLRMTPKRWRMERWKEFEQDFDALMHQVRLKKAALDSPIPNAHV